MKTLREVIISVTFFLLAIATLSYLNADKNQPISLLWGLIKLEPEPALK